MNPLKLFEFPEELAIQPKIAEEHIGDTACQRARWTADELAALCEGMRRRKALLTQLPLNRIVAALDKASRFWMKTGNPQVAATIERVAAATGMSMEMVTRAIVHEMESSLEPDLNAALANEIGNPAVLDGFDFNPHLGGETFATGPELVGGIVSANIPALPHLTVMRSLLVKSPCVIKSSTSEPFFLPEYVRTLVDVDPEVGACVAVIEFGREHLELTRTFLGSVDFLIAYGGMEAVEELRRLAPSSLATLFHGHKLGFGMVSSDGLDTSTLAQRMAYDAVLFDQEACLAPHVYFIEADEERTLGLARDVLASMGTLGVELPPGRRPIAWKLAIRQELDRLALLGVPCLTGEDPRLGVVTVERNGSFSPSPLGRFLRLCPVERLEHVLETVEGMRGLLQNVAIEAPEERRRNLATKLALLGVSRVCPPGNMGTPTMMWHHDGRPCLSEMLSFTDYEVRGGISRGD